MLYHGLKTLDKLEEAEQKEKDKNNRYKYKLTMSIPPTSKGRPLDFSGIAIDPKLVLLPSFQEGLGFVNRTPPITIDS